ncbi:MAG: hypothetical protein IKD33_03585 [Bacteroidales bacterium]|nr:hypothetical protein [Bacteroidales bacterium]
MWKDSNEEGFYSFDSAIAVFNNSLPSKEEMEELVNTCKSEWDGANYKITGPNKNYIILPAADRIIDGTYADAYSICVQGCIEHQPKLYYCRYDCSMEFMVLSRQNKNDSFTILDRYFYFV